MANIDDLNILTNGNFLDGLTGWTVNNQTGRQVPHAVGGCVGFNAGNKTTFGDSINKDFIITIGNTFAIMLDLVESNGVVANHFFQGRDSGPHRHRDRDRNRNRPGPALRSQSLKVG